VTGYPPYRRRRAELTVQHAVSAHWPEYFTATDSGGYVVTEFLHIEGIEAVRNRRVWVRQGKDALAKALTALPAEGVPEHMKLSLAEVIAWLAGREES